jgi:hypothetical protein
VRSCVEGPCDRHEYKGVDVPTDSPREQWDPGVEACLIHTSVTHWLVTAYNLYHCS